MNLFLLLIQQVRHKFGGKMTNVQNVFQYALSWCKWNSEHVSNFMVSYSSIHWNFPYLSHIFMSCMLMDILNICRHQHRSNILALGKPLRNLCSSCLFSKGTFNISKVCAAFCPDLKHNLMQTHCSHQCAIFGVHQHHEWTNAHLYLTRITQVSALF